MSVEKIEVLVVGAGQAGVAMSAHLGQGGVPHLVLERSRIAEDRRKLLALARDLLNSGYAGHRLTFQLFAQSPPFAQSAAVYRTFDWTSTLKFAQKAGGMSDNIWGVTKRAAE